MILKYKNFIIENLKNGIILYRGVGLEEAIKSCQEGSLIYYSKNPMSMDWEVIKYGLGDEAYNMNELEIDNYIESIVNWKPIEKGVNLTSDLENAMGYSNIVLEIELQGDDYAIFSDSHYFAKNPSDCLIKSIYLDGANLTKDEFLKKVKIK